MSADLEGGKFVGCGELFVLSGNFKSPRTSGYGQDLGGF
jgi:hypothetical protein